MDAECNIGTVQYIHATLHKALKQGVRWRLAPRNVAEAAVPPKVQNKEIRVLSPDRVYSHVLKGMQAGAVRTMDDIFDG